MKSHIFLTLHHNLYQGIYAQLVLILTLFLLSFFELTTWTIKSVKPCQIIIIASCNDTSNPTIIVNSLLLITFMNYDDKW